MRRGNCLITKFQQFILKLYKEERQLFIFWCIAALLLVGFVFTRYYGFIINFTQSLPEKLFIYKYDDLNLNRNDTAVIVAEGLPNVSDGIKLIKRVNGFAGDKITVRGNNLYINEKLILSHFDTKAYWGDLHKIKDQVIPENCYFINGVSQHSFDSRYAEVGLVCKERIVGKAWALF